MLFSAEAQVCNMSLTGAAIETRHALREGETVTFKARPESDPIHMPATVVWCRKSSEDADSGVHSNALYSAGVEFLNVFTPEAKALLALMRNEELITVETRVTGRFRLELAERVLLNCEHEISVKQVSSTGMLIETGLSLELGSVFEMRVHLGTPFEAQGRVVHIQELTPIGGPPNYRLGVEFVELSPDNEATLVHFINGLGHRTESTSAGF
jgi:hypothetical protein